MKDSGIRLVAGLGNPGRDYAHTRHNAGFLVADTLAQRGGASFRHESKWSADVAAVGDLMVMKPMQFMNLSGQSVGDFCRFHKLSSERVLVVLDDVALPLGRLRIRSSGSAGGHNGLASVIAHLGTDHVPRLRVGIGAADHDLVDHVLGKFSEEELPILKDVLERATNAVCFASESGVEAAMNEFNPKQKSTKHEKTI